MLIIEKSVFWSACLLISVPVFAAPPASLFDPDNLPPGRAKDRISTLPPAAQKHALEWLEKFSIPVQDYDVLGFDDNGNIFYVEEKTLTEPSDTSESPEMSLSVSEAFALHSNPGAPNVIYLDFDGHEISGTAWNGTVSTYYAKPFDRDGSPSTFSQSEAYDIATIWHRVAEDYAAFNVDVTTELPAYFDANTGRVLITKSTDEAGQAMPYSTAGGVAYIGVWGRSNYAYYQPALVYYNNLGGGAPKYVAEAAAHEMGHNQGLSHDGTSSTTYYAGHGSGYTNWAPIMGNSYNAQVSQWSKGDYMDASNTQDDINIITNNLGLKTDDHGDQTGTASYLWVDSEGYVSASNPESDPDNFNPDNKGTISTRNDVDVFEFTAGSGLIDLTVTPAWAAYTDNNARGANLDARVALLNAAGTEVAVADPADNTSANIQYNAAGGVYFLSITGVGNNTSNTTYDDYGSEGSYFIHGHVPVNENHNSAPVATADTATINEGSQISLSVLNNDSDPDGDALTITIISSASLGQNSTNGTEILYTPQTNANGTDEFTYSIVDGNGGTASATVTVTITPVNDAPIAKDDVLKVDQNTAGTVAVLANDSDIDGDSLNIIDISSPLHGTASVSGQMINYVPATGYVGSDSFSYTIQDAAGITATATVNVTVAELIAPPATPQGLTAQDNASGAVSLTWLDTENEGNYEIQRETKHKRRNRWNGTTIVATLGADTTHFTDNTGSGTFRYRIRALNSAGTSAWSAWSQVSVTNTYEYSGWWQSRK